MSLSNLKHYFMVSYLNGSMKVHPKLMPLVDDCKSLLQKISNTQIHHAFKEANRYADAMASLGRSLSLGDLHYLYYFYSPLSLI